MQPQNTGKRTAQSRPHATAAPAGSRALRQGKRTAPCRTKLRQAAERRRDRAQNAKPSFKEHSADTTKEHTHVTRKRQHPRSLYADLFAEHELAALERTADNPLLQDEIGLLRMLIRRIAGQMLTAEDDERAPADKIKAVKDLTDILLNALKARAQLSPRAEDNLTEAMRQVIAEIETLEQTEEKAQERHHAE